MYAVCFVLEHIYFWILSSISQFIMQDTLHDLVPFVQYKKHEKHLWRSITFSKVTRFSLQLY